MSTTLSEPLPRSAIDRREALRLFISELENMRYLLRPEHLARRLNALDDLDAMMGGVQLDEHTVSSDRQLIARANALRSRFETANETIFLALRSAISLRGNSHPISRFLTGLARDRDAQGPRPGFGFDLLDEVVSGILKLRGPVDTGLLQSPEMVPYQPTPARHILNLIAAAHLSKDDTLVDLGSGLGHVPMLISILTGGRTLGVELEPDYVLSAEESARRLNLSSVQFVAADARMADLSSGSAFYLFSPFKGSILREVLQRLLRESGSRHIRICCLGPCTQVLQHEVWLKARTRPNREGITVFESR